MMTVETIKGMTSNQLLSQYKFNMDLHSDCYDNARDSYGEEAARWFCEMDDCSKNIDLLKAEILLRKANGSLYDGMRGTIKRVWDWAKGVGKDEEHIYNIVRRVMQRKHDIYMLPYRLSDIF